jgi:hypothetical protein
MQLRRRDIVCRQAVELVTDYLEGAFPPLEIGTRIDAAMIQQSRFEANFKFRVSRLTSPLF